MKHGGKVITEDRFCFAVRFPDGKVAVQRKRVVADCPVSAEIRKVYAERGIFAAIGEMRRTTHKTEDLRTIKEIFEAARGKVTRY